ncbi:MAG: ABC transporter ATP-binding protein [Rubrivivax sp.]|nr:ABC transporter ATP-binding protein [Rubrivivax sp.]
MRHIDKRFGAVHANRDVALTVRAGSVHGIVGENGAGKSTLMSILYGFYQADAGEIEIEGRPVRITGSRQAIALGVGMVHQHFMLVDTLSALDNVMLGAEPGWRLVPARASVRTQLEALMRRTGLVVNLDAPVQDLPVGERQRLEILKALFRGARLLILDEPTAVLTPQETEQLFVTLRALRAQGTTILLITHKLKEILALADHVTVMRQGQVVLDAPIGEVTLDSLAEAMVGRRVQLGRRSGEEGAGAAPGATLLQAHGLTWQDALGVPRLAGVSLVLREREIVGIAGVSGNGQSELLDVLAGLRVPQRGRLSVHTGRANDVQGNAGHEFIPGRWIDPATARTLHIAHVPEDRHRRGLVLPFDAWESATLGYTGWPRYARSGWSRGWLRSRAMRQDCTAMMERYDVRPRDAALRSSKFSGGNQQKLVLAREAFGRPGVPRVLLVGQPTRGVDIGAIEFIHGRLRAMRDAGGAVLVVSSELDEILALADRVIVMNAGRVAGELPIGECNEQTLGRLMGGGGT